MLLSLDLPLKVLPPPSLRCNRCRGILPAFQFSPVPGGKMAVAYRADGYSLTGGAAGSHGEMGAVLQLSFAPWYQRHRRRIAFLARRSR